MLKIKLEQLLKEKSISKYKFALMCGIRYDAITEYCRNNVIMLRKEYLEMFCRILNCKIEDLLEYKED